MQNGGRIIDNEKVIKIVPGEVITLKTTKREVKAKKIALTPGRCNNICLNFFFI